MIFFILETNANVDKQVQQSTKRIRFLLSKLKHNLSDNIVVNLPSDTSSVSFFRILMALSQKSMLHFSSTPRNFVWYTFDYIIYYTILYFWFLKYILQVLPVFFHFFEILIFSFTKHSLKSSWKSFDKAIYIELFFNNWSKLFFLLKMLFLLNLTWRIIITLNKKFRNLF